MTIRNWKYYENDNNLAAGFDIEFGAGLILRKCYLVDNDDHYLRICFPSIAKKPTGGEWTLQTLIQFTTKESERWHQLEGLKAVAEHIKQFDPHSALLEFVIGSVKELDRGDH